MQEIKEHLQDFNVEKTLSLFRREISAIDGKLMNFRNCGHIFLPASTKWKNIFRKISPLTVRESVLYRSVKF